MVASLTCLCEKVLAAPAKMPEPLATLPRRHARDSTIWSGYKNTHLQVNHLLIQKISEIKNTTEKHSTNFVAS